MYLSTTSIIECFPVSIQIIEVIITINGVVIRKKVKVITFSSLSPILFINFHHHQIRYPIHIPTPNLHFFTKSFKVICTGGSLYIPISVNTELLA
jgi:hypothetical protein